MIILPYFSKNVTNPTLNFRAFGRKTQIFWEILKFFDKISIRKIEFLTIFGKVFDKNRAFGNNIIFLRQFFQFRGGGTFPMFPPGGAYEILKSCSNIM